MSKISKINKKNNYNIIESISNKKYKLNQKIIKFNQNEKNRNYKICLELWLIVGTIIFYIIYSSVEGKYEKWDYIF